MINLPNASREALTRALQQCPPHYRPIILAVRDHGCGYALVIQDAGPFALPLDRPAIVLIGDDLHQSKGPAAFHEQSLSRVLRECSAAYIIASSAVEETYGKACVWPIALRQHVVIIETLPAHEDEWLEFVETAHPGINITISKVDPLARPEPQPWGRA